MQQPHCCSSLCKHWCKSWQSTQPGKYRYQAILSACFTTTCSGSTMCIICSGRQYLLHIEVTNLLLVLASTQLYTTTASAPTGMHPFLDSLMQQTQLAPYLVQQILQHFVARPSLPANLQLWSPSRNARNGVFQLVRSAAGVMLLVRCCSQTRCILS